jgi:hypothetical protein
MISNLKQSKKPNGRVRSRPYLESLEDRMLLAGSTTSLMASPNPSTYGDRVTFTATVTSPQGGVVPTGIVTFRDNGVSFGSGMLDASATATFSTPRLRVGSHTIMAAYAGDGNFDASTSTAIFNTVNPIAITVAANGNTKIYDGTTGASMLPTIISGNLVNGDIPAFTETYDNENIGSGKMLIPSGMVNDANGGNNYTVTFVVSSAGVITPRGLTVSGITAADKVYDATAVATLDTANAALVGAVPGDAVSLDLTNAAGAFPSRHAGTNLTVTVSGLALVGADAGNYTLTEPTTTASITPRDLHLVFAGADKVYDGTTSATAFIASDPLAGDDFLFFKISAGFADKNVGTNKTVTLFSYEVISTSGSDYTIVAFSNTTTASITARALTVSAAGQIKVYDGTTNAAVALTTDALAGDNVTASGTATFADKNAGVGKTVTVNSIAISGTDAGNYTLQDTTTTTTADITPRGLSITASGMSKVYDGTFAAMVTFTTDALSGDVVAVSGNAVFGSKLVGTGKTVTVSGITLGSTDAGNYRVLDTTVATSADITSRPLTVSASAASKVYDGTTAAIVTLTTDAVAGDDVTAGNTTATFANQNVGAGKTVSITGLSTSGGDAGNYTLVNATATATADITRRPITVTATTNTKVYDGTTSATATPIITGSGLAAGDTADFTESYDNKNAGTGKSLIPAGAVNDGNAGSNYAVTFLNSASGTINPAMLTVTATGIRRRFNGTTIANVTLSDSRIAGDSITDQFASAAFASASVGRNKTVTVTGISVSGTDAANYMLQNTTATTTADITVDNLHDVAEIFTHSEEHYIDFVSNLYVTILHRAADVPGLLGWVDPLFHLQMTDEQVEAAFLISPEYVNRHGGFALTSPNGPAPGPMWVTALYNDILGRPPTSSELQGWLNDLAAGDSALNVAAVFVGGVEKEQENIIAAFNTFLGRQPSQAEIVAYLIAFQAHAIPPYTIEDLRGDFVGSPEYYSRPTKGNGNDSTWVTSAYQDILGRAPSAHEVNDIWVPILESQLFSLGMGLSSLTPAGAPGGNAPAGPLAAQQIPANIVDVAQVFTQSDGHNRDFVFSLYQSSAYGERAILFRAPSDHEVNDIWVPILQQKQF